MILRAAAFAAVCLACGTGVASPPYRGPIIDVHMHAYDARDYHAVVPGNTDAIAPEVRDLPAAATAAAQRDETLAAMKAAGITLGLVSFDTPGMTFADERAVMRDWRSRGGATIRPGIAEHALIAGTPPAAIAAALRAGEFGQLSELGLLYHGMTADDPKLEPYLALAETLDVPVGIHMGSGPPESRERWPAFRMRYGNPLLLEDMLVRHPKLRVWFQHAGWPYLAETKAILEQYSNVYLDLSVVDWVIPRAEFHDCLQALIRAGFGDRLMFGSDQMIWPRAIPRAIDAIQSAPFLSTAQKQAILQDNAARFFRLADTH